MAQIKTRQTGPSAVNRPLTNEEIDNNFINLNAEVLEKVSKVAGKQLSTEDYTSAEKTKLAGIAAGATANSTDAQLRDRSTHTGTQAIATVTGLQAALDARVEKEAGKGLSSNDYTSAEKTKLAGIAANANNYVHPASHPASMIEQDASNRFVTDAEKARLATLDAALADKVDKVTGKQLSTEDYTTEEKTKLGTLGPLPPAATEAEMTAGIETAPRLMAPKQIKDVVDAAVPDVTWENIQDKPRLTKSVFQEGGTELRAISARDLSDLKESFLLEGLAPQGHEEFILSGAHLFPEGLEATLYELDGYAHGFRFYDGETVSFEDRVRFNFRDSLIWRYINQGRFTIQISFLQSTGLSIGYNCSLTDGWGTTTYAYRTLRTYSEQEETASLQLELPVYADKGLVLIIEQDVEAVAKGLYPVALSISAKVRLRPELTTRSLQLCAYNGGITLTEPGVYRDDVPSSSINITTGGVPYSPNSVVIGHKALSEGALNSSGHVAIGSRALQYVSSGDNLTGVGAFAGGNYSFSKARDSTYIGANTTGLLNDNQTTVIGAGATSKGSFTTVIGAPSAQTTYLNSHVLVLTGRYSVPAWNALAAPGSFAWDSAGIYFAKNVNTWSKVLTTEFSANPIQEALSEDVTATSANTIKEVLTLPLTGGRWHIQAPITVHRATAAASFVYAYLYDNNTPIASAQIYLPSVANNTAQLMLTALVEVAPNSAKSISLRFSSNVANWVAKASTIGSPSVAGATKIIAIPVGA